MSSELSRRFAESILFKDDNRFQQQTSTILQFLGKRPAYDLAYGRDPAMAAHCVRQMLMEHDLAGN
jgi:hypothetical protein